MNEIHEAHKYAPDYPNGVISLPLGNEQVEVHWFADPFTKYKLDPHELIQILLPALATRGVVVGHEE